ncbi:adenosylcobinamide-phosphate synthase CbiB [Aliibacillus thermotolerans]|uniref:Cobalamin biosynthesis protein CobD n=1 Tax=Aliibacillus thermotolerans TaxID=1834418 RepID=A0ABW0U684_9BACI|nr:adenosylcobinamide-phosphate synthase CbiB [Aliibacillus thermotolerans]MDA3128660.1 cobalamin biosynthesis protein CobD [Aliibacillus thermotolerans]
MELIFYHLYSITIAYLLDKWLGDPRVRFHPVVFIGKTIAFFARHLNKGKLRTLKGVVATLVPALLLTGMVYALTFVTYDLHHLLGIAFEAIMIWGMIGSKSMIASAESIYEALAREDIARARKQTAMIVSRDTKEMSEEEIVRATVESTGENITDSVTAPLFYALFGGGVAAFFYRYINTSDAMIGYKTREWHQYGKFAARLDDVLNYVPARLTALFMMVVSLKVRHASLKEMWQVVKQDAKKHASPNSGYGEATMAAILHIRLGGPTVYHGKLVQRPYLGKGNRPLTKERIKEGLTVWKDTIRFFIIFTWLIVGGFTYVLA